MAQPVRRYQAPAAGAATEARLLRPKQNAADCGMDAVSADQHIGRNANAIFKFYFDAEAVVCKASETMPRMHALRRNGP